MSRSFGVLNLFATPIDTTINVSALSPVPEPSEWAAASLVLLGLVFVAKRRFTSVQPG
ncbi:MAG: hypothetical protein WCK27_28045 [Verrucomicrobiota bacterium]